MFQMLMGKDIQISMISKYPWYPNIHDIQISTISKYPWYPNIHDIQISMMSKYPWCPNVQDDHTSKMWTRLSCVGTFVTCSHTFHMWSYTCGHTCHPWSHCHQMTHCHMWSHMSHVVTLVTHGHMCHTWSHLSPEIPFHIKYHKMAPHPTFETMIRWLLLLHLFASSPCRPAGRSRW